MRIQLYWLRCVKHEAAGIQAVADLSAIGSVFGANGKPSERGRIYPAGIGKDGGDIASSELANSAGVVPEFHDALRQRGERNEACVNWRLARVSTAFVTIEKKRLFFLDWPADSATEGVADQCGA